MMVLICRVFEFVPDLGRVQDGEEWWEERVGKGILAASGDGRKEVGGGTTGEKTFEGHRCYQILKGSAKPKDGMPGRVRVREGF